MKIILVLFPFYEKLYVGHINTHGKILMEFEDELSKSEKLKKACKEFEVTGFNLTYMEEVGYNEID